MKKPRFYATVGAVAVVLLAVVVVPLPHHVICPLEIQPYDAAPVYVEVPGALDAVHVQPGQQVEGGAALADLSNIDVQLAIAQLETQRAEHEAQFESLRRQRFLAPEVSGQLNQVRKSLDSIVEQISKRSRDVERLRLVAPRSGSIIPAPAVPAPSSDNSELPTWSGTPFNSRNVGCHLTSGVLFCLVGDPTQLEAVLVIDQGDIEFVREGNSVEIMLDELPGEIFDGKIETIAEENVKVVQRALSNKAGGDMATITDESGQERPQSTSYQARVRLTDEEHMMRISLRGRAKIRTRPRTLGQRLWRFLSQTFRLSA